MVAGIDWCHLHDYERVLQEDQETVVSPPQYVKAATGMAGVVPAWRLLSLLNCDNLKTERDAEDERISKSASAI